MPDIAARDDRSDLLKSGGKRLAARQIGRPSDENDIVDQGTGLEERQRALEDRLSGELEEDLVELRPHPDPFPTRNHDRCGSHGRGSTRTGTRASRQSATRASISASLPATTESALLRASRLMIQGPTATRSESRGTVLTTSPSMTSLQ